MSSMQAVVRSSSFLGVVLAVFGSTPAVAQEVRYSYLEMSFMGQDVDRTGSQTPQPNQTVDYDVSDGSGISFRGSVGTWNNLYLFVDYSSTDIDVDAIITNPAGEVFPTGDEFDLTTVRGGVGLRYPLGLRTDAYGELTYDSSDLDFGSFALENFDTGDKGVGGSLGVRHLLSDNIELRGWGRYTSVGDVSLVTRTLDTDVLFGVGIGWQVIRGFSIEGDFESGEFSNVSLGFRLDLDEN